MRGQTLEGEILVRRLSGFEAVCAQHEYDHLDGILNTDRIPAAARVEIAGQLAALVV